MKGIDHERRSFSSGDIAVRGKLRLTFGKNAITNVSRWKISCTFHQHHRVLVYLYQTKATVTYFYSMRIELVVKLVFEVKGVVDFLFSQIYDYRTGPSLIIMQNLPRENELLSWSILINDCLCQISHPSCQRRRVETLLTQ